jgi:amino acid transporter
VAAAPGISVHAAVLQAGVLAFYAFIGFEDLANLAEEVREPEKTLPRAILIALAVAAVIYILVALAAVSAVPPAELAQSSAPLVLVVSKGFPLVPKELFTFVALFAVTNTALINFIMSSRILYGMAQERLVPSILSQVHPKTQTPHMAIAFVFVVALLLALTGQVVILAQSTSFLLLAVFCAMNLALAILKLRKGSIQTPFRVPIAVPIFGALCCFGLGLYVGMSAFLTVIFLIATGFLLYFFQRLLFRF